MKLISFLALLFATCLASASELTRIAFGSCSHQDKEQPIWDAVLAEQPHWFVFLGDNVYADTREPEQIRASYNKLAAIEGFRQLKNAAKVVATWDDHDYGENDAGREYPVKDESRKIMLEFWGEARESARWNQAGGIYTSYLSGEAGRRVQIILLDLRWNRTALQEIQDKELLEQRVAANMGPYEASLSESATLLGEAQWAWLEKQLQVEADVRIIGSSIQLLSDFTGWESWSNFPRERQRFISLLEKYQAEPLIIISGDTHWSELSVVQSELAWPLVELTSSGLTQEWKNVSPNRHRVGEPHAEANYGLLLIDWQGSKPAIRMQVKSVSGDVLIEHRYEEFLP